MNFEFFILYNTKLIYSNNIGIPLFSDDQKVLVVGFISALDSFSKSAMQTELEEIKFSNSIIYFRREQGCLFVLLFPDYTQHSNISKFFDSFIPQIITLLEVREVLPSKRNELQIDDIFSSLTKIILEAEK